MTFSHSWKYKGVTFVGGLAFWLLYAISSGIIRYYSWNLAKYYNTNPVYFTNFSSLKGVYDSMIIWFPGDHFVVVLSVGIVLFSILLSLLFSLSILMISHSLRTGLPGRKPGLIGFLGLVPAMLTGGCCALPLGIVLSLYVAPAAFLFNLAYDHSFFTNATITGLMLVSVFYTGRKTSREACETKGSRVAST